MLVRLTSLAHTVIMLADNYHLLPGEPLPEDHVEAFLEAYPFEVEAVIAELYANDLLEDIYGKTNVLTEDGFSYVLANVHTEKNIEAGMSHQSGKKALMDQTE